jgi:hypothetical protein
MLFKEIIALYSENYMKPVNTLGGKNAESFIVQVGYIQSVRKKRKQWRVHV